MLSNLNRSYRLATEQELKIFAVPGDLQNYLTTKAMAREGGQVQPSNEWLLGKTYGLLNEKPVSKNNATKI